VNVNEEPLSLELEPLSLELTVPDTALLELSLNVNVLAVIDVLSIVSLKEAEMLMVTEEPSPPEGEVDETVGAVVSSLKA
jgi:hypothetical protein